MMTEDESHEARVAWNNWTETGKLAFITQHGFNPRFANYAWAMLPYSVQQMVLSTKKPLSIPHVVGNCGACGYAYDLTKGIGCPQCSSAALSWAFHASSEDEQADLIQRLRDKLDPLVTFNEGDKLDIDELERLFKL